MNWPEFLQAWCIGLWIIALVSFITVAAAVSDGHASKLWWLVPALIALGALIIGSLAAGLGK